jgi:ATP synthase mitochondrial F1 complex assembly factor 1
VVLEKYREKLDRKAREEGVKNIDELKAIYADKIESLRKKDVVSTPPFPSKNVTPTREPSHLTPAGAPPPPPTAAATSSSATSSQGVKTLSAILDLPKVSTLPDTELSTIWRLRHASSPNTLCAVIPASTYTAMEEAAKSNPQFVLPVPHEGQGAEIHFLQWVFDPESKTSTVMFTHLAEFKTRGEFAVPHTTITHHTDLVDSRGLVLMQGQIVEDRGVKPDHAQWLIMCLQRFYGGWDGEMDADRKERAIERKKLLEWFAAGDPRFSVERLMEEAERLG